MVEAWPLDKALKLLNAWRTQGATFHFLVITPSGVKFTGLAWVASVSPIELTVGLTEHAAFMIPLVESSFVYSDDVAPSSKAMYVQSLTINKLHDEELTLIELRADVTQQN